MSKGSSNWKTFAWRNLRYEVPSDWTLGAINGDDDNGYLRLDDDVMPRMEVKWKSMKTKKNKKAPSLSDVVEKFLDDLEKSVSKKKFSIHIERDVNPDNFIQRLPGKEYMAFVWKSESKALGIASYCEECGKVVITQIVSKLEDDMSKIVPRIFKNYEDHPVDGVSHWSVYDLEMDVPQEYVLRDQKLMPGYLKFVFNKPKIYHENLEIERWGLSDVHLKNNKPVGEWFKNKYKTNIKPYRLQYEQIEIMGHDAIRVEGVKRRPLHDVRRSLERIVHSKTPTNIHMAYWHCPETKKIYVIHMNDRHEDGPVIDFVSSSILCHTDEDGAGEEENKLDI